MIQKNLDKLIALGHNITADNLHCKTCGNIYGEGYSKKLVLIGKHISTEYKNYKFLNKITYCGANKINV